MNPLYSPYGAYEMKAAYQRNGLKASLWVAGIGCLLGLTLTLYDRLPEEQIVIIPPTPPIIISSELFSKAPKIKSEQPRPKAAVSAPVEEGIPTPVPDETMQTEELQSLPESELSGTSDSLFGGGTGTEDGIGGVGGDLPGEYIAPPPDSFVPVEKEAVAIYECKPDYPRFARQAGLEGVVYLFVLVAANGGVKEVRINKASGVTVLDEAAKQCAYNNMYSPAIQNGIAIDYWMGYKVIFELE